MDSVDKAELYKYCILENCLTLAVTGLIVVTGFYIFETPISLWGLLILGNLNTVKSEAK